MTPAVQGTRPSRNCNLGNQNAFKRAWLGGGGMLLGHVCTMCLPTLMLMSTVTETRPCRVCHWQWSREMSRLSTYLRQDPLQLIKALTKIIYVRVFTKMVTTNWILEAVFDAADDHLKVNKEKGKHVEEAWAKLTAGKRKKKKKKKRILGCREVRVPKINVLTF